MNISSRKTDLIHQNRYLTLAVMTALFVLCSCNQLLVSANPMENKQNNNWLTAIKNTDASVSNLQVNFARKQFRNKSKFQQENPTISQLFSRSRSTNISR